MTLYDLFFRCVTRPYIRTPYFADYAFDLTDGHLTVFFQDSDGVEDWLNNLDFPVAPCEREGKTVFYAHGGFLRLWTSLIPRIDPLLTNGQVNTVTVVGYSHGAALGLLCHEYAWYRRPDLRATLTGYGFGCPRVIWGKVTDDVALRWRGFTVIRNREDIVTHLPPRFLGYTHVGSLLEIGERGKYTPIDAHRPESIARELLPHGESGGYSVEK